MPRVSNSESTGPLGILQYETSTTSDVDMEAEEERRVRSGEAEATRAA